MSTSAKTSAAFREPPREHEAMLAQRAFAGDPRAFEAIVVRYQGPVLGLARRYLRSTADAEDAAQEAFVRAFVHRARFDPARPLLPWLLTVARHVCLDRLRREARTIAADDAPDGCALEGVTAEDAASGREQLARLARALDALPEGQREVVAMFHLDGLAYREIAEALDVPIGTVMTWLHRGRARLKELVCREPDRDAAAVGTRSCR